MGGGAWPFLVRGLTCLVNSVNERDLDLLIGQSIIYSNLLEGLCVPNTRKREAITGL